MDNLTSPPFVINMPISENALHAFCEHWHVRELALFGSVLRGDFDLESDVDVLVQFDPPSNYSLTVLLDMKEELERLFNRPVDLIVKTVVEQDDNPYRRREILNSAKVIYHAG